MENVFKQNFLSLKDVPSYPCKRRVDMTMNKHTRPDRQTTTETTISQTPHKEEKMSGIEITLISKLSKMQLSSDIMTNIHSHHRHRHIGIPKDLMTHIHPHQNPQVQETPKLELHAPQTLTVYLIPTSTCK